MHIPVPSMAGRYMQISACRAWTIRKSSRQPTVKEREIQARRMVFNVLMNNRDDHAKNFSFVLNEEGEWKVSPAYDLTFQDGPGGEHQSAVMGHKTRA